MSESDPRRGAISNIPIPDPSAITTFAIAEVKRELREEIAKEVEQLATNSMERRETLRQQTDQRIATVEALAAQNRADFTAAIKDAAKGVTELFEAKLSALQKLTDERIDGLKIAFREEKIAATTAVSAAFAAQEKLNVAQNFANATATSKSETYFTKEIEAVKGVVVLNQDRVKSELSNLSDRVNRDQGAALGAQQQMATNHVGISTTISAAIGVVAVLALLVSAWSAVNSHSPGGITVPPPVTLSPTR